LQGSQYNPGATSVFAPPINSKGGNNMSDAGCARPTGANVVQATDPSSSPKEPIQETQIMATAQVGKAAPDFGAPAYKNGEFTAVKLSEYVEKGWTLLCFYPGDFTYV
jgi:hypothetical protein